MDAMDMQQKLTHGETAQLDHLCILQDPRQHAEAQWPNADTQGDDALLRVQSDQSASTSPKP